MTELEVWEDPERDISRRSSRSWAEARLVDRSEGLVRGGVLTMLQSSQTETGTEWSSVLEYDAEIVLGDSRGDPFGTSGAGLNAYKDLLRSKEATLVGSTETSGVPTYRLRFDTPGLDQGTQTVLVDVRRSDFLPVLVKGTEWYLDDGVRMVWREWTTRYEVMEVMSRYELPDSAFQLAIPAGLPHHSDYALTVSQASREHEGIRAYWLGASFGERSLDSDRLRYERSEGRLFAMGNPRRIRDLLGMVRPRFGPRSITAQYGADDDWRVQTITFTPVPRGGWRFPQGTQTQELMVQGRPAVLASHRAGLFRGDASESGEVRWLVVELDDATVLLQGWDVSPQEMIAAAEQLRHVDDRP